MSDSEFDIQNYTITYGGHKDKPVIFFGFPFNDKLKTQLRNKLTVYWSNTKKSWYCLDMDQYRKLLNLPLKPIGELATPRIHEVNISAYRKMQEQLILKAYSPSTQKIYLSEFSQLLYILGSHPVQNIEPERIRAYMLYCSNKLKLKEATLHSRMNALKFYFQQVEQNEKLFLEIPRPKKPKALPKVLSKNDLKKMFTLTDNLKHRVILQLVYGMGLRVSEIVHLKISNIDSSRMMVHVQSAKGKKDRYMPLPESILEQLRDYYRIYRPKEYVFEGQAGGQYTIRSVQAVFKQAMNRAKIYKPIGIHGLRHSYATHLMEAGTDMTFIQKLLGHNDIKTTMIYAKVSHKEISKVISPLDSM